MPKAVVDDLEFVQVHEQHRDLAAPPIGTSKGAFEAIHEQRPVRQPCKRIMERLMAELLLQGLAFGYVARGYHHAPHSRVVEQVVDDMLEVAPRAILVGHSELQWRVKPGYFQDLGECVQRPLSVVRMNGAECGSPYLLFRRVARHPLDRRTHVANAAVG